MFPYADLSKDLWAARKIRAEFWGRFAPTIKGGIAGENSQKLAPIWGAGGAPKRRIAKPLGSRTGGIDPLLPSADPHGQGHERDHHDHHSDDPEVLVKRLG
jgi:hypothetical protein